MNPETFNMVLKFLEKLVEDEDEYQCKYCEELFPNTKELTTHSITSHLEKRMICDFCLREFKFEYFITKHIDQNHMALNLCLNVKPKKPKLKPKVKEIDDYEPETESETDDSDYDQYNDEGKKNKKPDREYPRKCDHCDYVVPMKRVHYYHYLIMHSNIIDQYPYGATHKLPCSFCGIIQSVNRLAQHEAKHSGIKVKCTLCDKQFANNTLMKRHMRSIHTELRLICHFCTKGFKTREEITRHIRIHTGEKPYKCHICGAGFAHSGNRLIHIRSIHQNIKSVPKKNNKQKEKTAKNKQIKNKQKKDRIGRNKKDRGSAIKRKDRVRAIKEKDRGCAIKEKGRGRPKKVTMDGADSESDNETLSVIQKKKNVQLPLTD